MRVGLIVCDSLREVLPAEIRSYDALFYDLLVEHEPALRLRVYDPQVGQWPARTDECERYVITGSRAGANDRLPWIARLENWIRRIVAAGRPLVGICFGHQIIARALGGTVVRSAAGWGVGVHCHEVAAPGLASALCSSELKLLYSHRDQVSELPPETSRLAGNAFCPNGAFELGQRVLCFQGHPEFTVEVARYMLRYAYEDMPDRTRRAAWDTLHLPTDSRAVGRLMLEHGA